MRSTTISRGVFLMLIVLSNLSPAEVNGQSLLKKIQNAAKEIGKQIQTKPSTQTPTSNNQNKLPDTPAASPTDNKVSSTNKDNSSNSVDAAPKGVSKTNTPQQKPLENNASPQNLQNVYVSIRGINYELATLLRNYLNDKTQGMYGFQDKAAGMTFFDIMLTTSLNKNDLVSSIVKTIEAMNSKLLDHIVDTTNLQVVIVTMSDKPLHFKTKETKDVPNEQRNGKNEISSVKPVAVENDKITPDSDDEKIYIQLRGGAEASFPGNSYGFQVYLKENLNTNIPKKNGAPAGSYQVNVKFLVRKDGSVSDVKALNKPGYGMENEAIRVIAGGRNGTLERLMDR